MPSNNNILRRMLVQMDFGMPEITKQINAIKAELDKVNEKAKRQAVDFRKEQERSNALTKQAILDQKRLQEEAKTLAAVDKAKAEWNRKNQEATKAQIQQRVLETAEAKKQQTLDQGAVRLQEQKLRLQQQIAKETERQEAILRRQTKERQAQLDLEKRTQVEMIERERRAAARAKVEGVVSNVGSAVPAALNAKQIAERKESIADEKLRLSIMEKQLRLMTSQEGIKKEDLIATRTQLSNERAKLTLQEAQLRQSEMLLRKTKEGGFITRVRESFKEGMGKGLGSIFGGGLFGQVATGAFTGFVGAELFSGLIENLHKLGEAIVEETGHSHQLRLEFMRLAQLRGIVPDEMLNNLRTATRGLVADTELFKLANNILRSGIKASNEDIIRLISNTVNLGRSMAKTPEEISSALSRAFLNPQYGMRALAMVTGIQTDVLRRAMQGVPQNIDPAIRATMTFNHILAEEEKMLTRVGVVVTTLPELFVQLRTAQRNFIDDMAMGLTGTNNFKGAIQKLSTWLIQHHGDLEKWAVTLGKGIADAATFAANHLTEIKEVAEVLLGLKVMSWAGKVAEGIYGIGTAAIWAVEKLGVLKAAEIGTTGTTVATAAGEGVVGAESAAGAGGLAALASPLGVIAATVLLIYGFIQEWRSEGKEAEQAHAQALINNYQTYGSPLGAKGATRAPRTFGSPTAARAYAQSLTATQAAGMARGANMLEWLQSTTPAPGASAGDLFGSSNNLPYSDQKKLLQQEMQLRTIMAKTMLEIAKQQSQNELDILRNQYDAGLISLKDYVTKQKAIRQEMLTDTLKEIEAEKQAKLDQINKQKTFTIDGQTYDVQIASESAKAREIVIKQSAEKEVAARTKTQEEINSVDRQYLSDQESAYREYTNGVLQISKSGVEQRTQVLEKEFAQGTVFADDYIQERKNLIQEEYQLTVQGLNDILKAAKDNATEQAKVNVELIQAEIDREKKLSDVVVSENATRMKALEGHFQQAKKFLDTSLKISQARVGPEASQEQLGIQISLIQLTRQYIGQLQEKQRLEYTGSENWININEQIAQATQEEQQLNIQLRESLTASESLSNIFGRMGSVFENFRSTTLKGVAETFQNISRSMSQIAVFERSVAQSGGTGSLFHNIREGFTSLFKKTPVTGTAQLTAQQIFDQGLSKSSQTLGTFSLSFDEPIAKLHALANALQAQIDATTGKTKGVFPAAPNIALPTALNPIADILKSSGSVMPKLGKNNPISDVVEQLKGLGKASKDATGNFVPFSKKLEGLTNTVGGVVQGIGGFVSSITSAKSAGQGMLQGGLSGMQLGAQFGGPIGAAIGGAAGMITGGIFGAKEKQLQRDIHKIQVQMQEIVDSMNAGTISMGQAIADMRRERQAAIQMLAQDPKGNKGGSKGKKGTYSPSQAQAVIDQIDAQIAQLVNQQQELLSQLDQQIAILSQPTAFQGYVQSLDTIIQKWQQFASAAQGNAQAVGNAQLYLQESLQQYVQTLSVQLNDAQQQAIQDALQLLNLEHQRQEIINQEAQQEYDVLTQGVLTRQRTTAMTKGQEIGYLRYQRDMQLQQIDEQIALQQYKVQTEQKIFDLATTRIGLETQLLSVQEAQAGYQAQQVAALAQVVQQLQAGMASGSLMNQLNQLYSGGALPSGTSILTTILGQLGLGGNVPSSILTGTGGATNYLAQIPQQFQGVTNFINNIDPNFLQNLWQAMQSPPGSSQRMAVLQEALPYQKDALTSGYDFNGLMSWIQGGAAITGTTASITNAPVATGPGQLPAGTAFPMPTQPGQSPSSIAPGPGTGGQSPFQSIYSPLTAMTTTSTPMAGAPGLVVYPIGTLQANSNTVAQGIATGYAGAAQGAGSVQPILSGIYSLSTVPKYDSGGYISSTGPYIGHAGEYVLTKPIVSLLDGLGGAHNVISNIITSVKGTGGSATPIHGPIFPTGAPDVVNSQLRIAAEQHITSLASARNSMELSLINAKKNQTNLDMLHLQMLQDTWDKIKQDPIAASGMDLETMFMQKYNLRGRYGSAGFRREVL